MFVSPPRSAYLDSQAGATPGNNLPGHSSGFISFYKGIQCPDTDAPMFKLCYGSGKWHVDGISCAGGMGPGDFVTYWENPEDKIADILDFYFGSPLRMNLKHRIIVDGKMISENDQLYPSSTKDCSVKDKQEACGDCVSTSHN